jgi:hypothetical protein
MRALVVSLFLVALLAGCGGGDQSDSNPAGTTPTKGHGVAERIVHDCLESSAGAASSHDRLVGPIKKTYRRCVNRRVHDAVKAANLPRSALKQLGHL